MRLLHRALPDHLDRRGVEAADAVEDAGDRHLGERHGDRRPRAAPPRGGAAGCAQHGAVRRLPGGRHARAAARGRRRPPSRSTARSFPSTPRIELARFDVGACRLARDPALARRVHQAAADRRSSSTGSRPRWKRWRVDHGTARLARPRCRSTARRSSWIRDRAPVSLRVSASSADSRRRPLEAGCSRDVTGELRARAGELATLANDGIDE